MSQIIDRSTRHPQTTEDDSRSKRRYTRTIPVLLGPWDKKKADINHFTVAITNDVSDAGIAASVPFAWTAVDVLCGFWCDQPVFIQGRVRRKASLGGNFWQLGIELQEIVRASKISNIESLNEIARALDNRPVF